MPLKIPHGRFEVDRRPSQKILGVLDCFNITDLEWRRSSLQNVKFCGKSSQEFSKCEPSFEYMNYIVVQSLSHVQLSVTPWTTAQQSPLSSIICSLLRFTSIESVMLFKHLILGCALLLWPSVFPSIMVFSSESALHIRWLMYCSFSFSINPSNEYSRLISFGIDWFDLLAVPGTLKASTLQHSAFSMVQLSHLYMTTTKPIH